MRACVKFGDWAQALLLWASGLLSWQASELLVTRLMPCVRLLAGAGYWFVKVPVSIALTFIYYHVLCNISSMLHYKELCDILALMGIPSATIQAVKTRATWKLPELLKREGITPYRLHKDIEESEGGKASRNTIYRWSRELPDTLDVALLMSVVYALRKRTGKGLSVCDLLEYEAEKGE